MTMNWPRNVLGFGSGESLLPTNFMLLGTWCDMQIHSRSWSILGLVLSSFARVSRLFQKHDLQLRSPSHLNCNSYRIHDVSFADEVTPCSALPLQRLVVTLLVSSIVPSSPWFFVPPLCTTIQSDNETYSWWVHWFFSALSVFRSRWRVWRGVGQKWSIFIAQLICTKIFMIPLSNTRGNSASKTHATIILTLIFRFSLLWHLPFGIVIKLWHLYFS